MKLRSFIAFLLLLADQVHPSASGARKMADQWLKALLPLLQKAP